MLVLEEEGRSLPVIRDSNTFGREQLLLTIAYGFFLACTSVILWGGYLRAFVGEGISDALVAEHVVRNTAAVAAHLTAGVVAYHRPKARGWRSPLVVVALLAFGAVVAATCLANAGSDKVAEWLLVIIGASFGWGSGAMLCTLQEIVASQKVFTAGIVVFAAAGVSALLFFSAEWLPASISPWVLLVFSAPVSALLAVSMRRRLAAHPMFEVDPSQKQDRCRAAVEELWRPLMCVGFSGIVVGIARAGSVTADGLLGQTNVSNMVGLLVASVALLATWRLLYERVTLTRLYQILFPLTATAFLVLPLLEGSFRQIVLSLVFLVFSITCSLMVVSCARTARNQSLPPVLVYGLFAGVVYACLLVGSLVGLFVGAGQDVGLAELAVLALVAVYVLSLLMLAPHNKRKREADAPVVQTAQLAGRGEFGDAVSERCAAVVHRYDLSRREAEVLDLLARGRDVPYVAEELVISKNTVRSHAKKIFLKTGVHSRQELIDLVESIET